MNKLSGLTIVARLAGGFGLMMALLIATTGVGAFGIEALFTNAHRAMTNDVHFAQTASGIGQLILNERRFEKDIFINIGDAGLRASYKKKWDTAKSALDEQIAAASRLDLAESDEKALGEVGAGFRSYADGFERTYARIEAGQIKTTQEANGEFAAFKAAVHGMEDAGEALNGMAVTRVNKAAESLSTTHQRSSILQVAIALICLLIGTVMCILTIRSITKPLSRAVEIARAVAGGKLDNTIDVIGRDETGQLLSALKTIQDSLLESELNAKGQIAAIGKAKAVAEFGLDGTILAANEHLLRMFGYGFADIKDRHHSLFVDPAVRSSPDYLAFWAKLGRGEYDAGQYQRITRDGREIFLQASYNPILGIDGKPYKIVEYASDVTDQVKLQIDQATLQGDQLKMKEALDMAVAETREVVQSAIDGALTKRIGVAGKNGQIEALATSVNSLIDSMMTMVTEIKRAAGEVQSGANEISSGNVNLSQRTEQGRGFAVVASEVRTLAGRSATAAKEIKTLIGDSVARVEEGSKLVGDSGKALDDIGMAVKRVTDVVAEIASASHEQASGIEQVNKAVIQMEGTTQQNAALVEEAAAASESIVGQAAHLADLVARWDVAGLNPGEMAAPAAKPVTPPAERRSANRPWKQTPKAPAGRAAAAAAAATRPARRPMAAAGGGDWKEF